MGLQGSAFAKAKSVQGETKEKGNLFERCKENTLKQLDTSILHATERWVDGKGASQDNPVLIKTNKSGKDLPIEKWKLHTSGFKSDNFRIGVVYEYEDVPFIDEETGKQKINDKGQELFIKKAIKIQPVLPEEPDLKMVDDYGEPVLINKRKDIPIGQETVYCFIKVNGSKWTYLEADGKTGLDEIKENPKQVISTIKVWKDAITDMTIDSDMGKEFLEFAKSKDIRRAGTKKGGDYKWSDAAVDFVKK
jgi:hypothetical protein